MPGSKNVKYLITILLLGLLLNSQAMAESTKKKENFTGVQLWFPFEIHYTDFLDFVELNNHYANEEFQQELKEILTLKKEGQASDYFLYKLERYHYRNLKEKTLQFVEMPTKKISTKSFHRVCFKIDYHSHRHLQLVAELNGKLKDTNFKVLKKGSKEVGCDFNALSELSEAS